MTQPIDIAFLAAKVAALRDEKAKVLVDGASLVYNVAMVNSLMNIQKEYISVCCTSKRILHTGRIQIGSGMPTSY